MSKHVLVLARRDVSEAMRVAAGLTIRNNTVDFVFMTEPKLNALGRIKNMEFLELAEIIPQTLVDLDKLHGVETCQNLEDLIQKSDRVVSF